MERKQTIAQLIKTKRYDPTVLPDLESYVKEQIQQNFYDLEANLAVLKLYQYQPSLSNTDIISKILIKSLMALPANDFSLCMFLIPDQLLIDNAQLVALQAVSDLLETAKFPLFWKKLEDDLVISELLKQVPGFDASIRKYILDLLSITYQRMPTNFLKEVLAIKDEELENYVPQSKYPRQNEGQYIVFPVTEWNQAKQKEITEQNLLEFVLASKKF